MIEIVNRETGEVFDADSIPGLAEIAASHEDRIRQLGELLEELSDDEGQVGGGTQRPVVWHQLSRHEWQRTWRGLAEWVGWLRGRYPLAHRIPLCWWRHPELVEELSALWLAWRDAYVEKGAPLTAGADWHSRWLPEFLRRIGAGGWNLACEGDHRPAVGSLYDGRRIDDDTDFEHYLAQSGSDREVREGRRTMNDDEMQRAVDGGTAKPMGNLPDAPVSMNGEFWSRKGDDWVAVESAETIAFLRDADRRMALADQAVDDIESS